MKIIRKNIEKDKRKRIRIIGKIVSLLTEIEYVMDELIISYFSLYYKYASHMNTALKDEDRSREEDFIKMYEALQKNFFLSFEIKKTILKNVKGINDKIVESKNTLKNIGDIQSFRNDVAHFFPDWHDTIVYNSERYNAKKGIKFKKFSYRKEESIKINDKEIKELENKQKEIITNLKSAIEKIEKRYVRWEN